MEAYSFWDSTFHTHDIEQHSVTLIYANFNAIILNSIIHYI